MSWLKNLFGGKKKDKGAHEGHENCEGGVCKPEHEAPAETPSEPQAPEQGGSEQAM